jgi:signal transduction histidine kinase
MLAPAKKVKSGIFYSIRFKAVFLMACMVAGAALISGLYFSWHARKLVFDLALERMRTIGETFAFNAEYGLLIGDQEVLSKLARGPVSQPGILAAIVMDSKGGVISREPQPLNAESQRKIRQHFPHMPQGVKAPIRENLNQFGDVYILFFPVYTEAKKGSGELGLFEAEEDRPKELIGYTAILFSPEAIFAKVKKIQMGILILLIFFSLAIMIFIYFVSNLFVQQLMRLLEAIQKIRQGDLSARVGVQDQDELGKVCTGFNQMAEVLEKTTVSRDALAKEIEERKRLEQMMLQAEKMSAIGQLAGGVAHEINNPLGVILGFAQNVVKRIQPGDPFEMPLKSIEREAVRCKNLVQDLLTFSRVGKTEKESVDLKESIEGALSLVLAQSKVKNVDLTREFSEVPRIMANKTQVQQIVINLCNNAMDAMPKGGKIFVRLQKANREGQEGIEIQVQDNGQGIPPEIQSKIFNPFFTTKEIGKGTGLGLSLVFEIVSKHNGKIFLDSEVGKGTTFHVFLPLTS